MVWLFAHGKYADVGDDLAAAERQRMGMSYKLFKNKRSWNDKNEKRNHDETDKDLINVLQ